MTLSELCKEADYIDKSGILFKGDCLEIMKDIPNGSVDMILCDLPYGTTACKWDNVIPFEPLWEQYKRIIKKNGAIVLFGSQPFTTALIMSNIKEYKATWYWKKERGTNFVQAKRYPMRVIEECLLFCKGTPTYNPILREVKPYSHVLPKPKKGSSQHMNSKSVDLEGSRIYKSYNTAYPINVLEFSRDNMAKGKSLHPTQKPVALLEYLIKTHSNENEVVLDNCMGSGTTCVASKILGRKYIGIELDEGYFNIAKERVSNIII